MVHVTDVKKITLMEQVADECEQLGKEGRFSKKCIPRGYIPDFDWTTIHQDQDQPIKPIKQQDPTEDTTISAAPTEVEGPPSSCLRSKTKQHRPPTSRVHWNAIRPQRTYRNAIQPKYRSTQWKLHQSVTPMQLTKLLLYTKRITKHQAPVGTRCTVAVAMAAYNSKCKQTAVKTVQ